MCNSAMEPVPEYHTESTIPQEYICINPNCSHRTLVCPINGCDAEVDEVGRSSLVIQYRCRRGHELELLRAK
jgi:hypothetical protein